jgi:hypothetical protein
MLTTHHAIYGKQEAAANKGNVHSKIVQLTLICYLAGCLQKIATHTKRSMPQT